MKQTIRFFGIFIVFASAIAMDAPPGKKITPPVFVTQLSNPGPAQAIRYSSDNQNLIITGMDPKITIWDTADYSKPKSQFNMPIGAAWCMDLNPMNSHQAAIGFVKGIIELWNLETQKMSQTLVDTDSIFAVQSAPDGSAILSASNNGACKLWDLCSNTNKTFDAKAGPVWSAHLNPALPNQFAACSDDNTLTVWDMRKESQPLHSIKEEVPVYCVTHNDEGKILIAAAYQFILRNQNAELLALYNTHGRKMAANKAVLAGTGDVPLEASAIKFMPGNNQIFAGGLDNGQIVIGDLEKSDESIHFDSSQERFSIQSLDISSDGQRLAVGTFPYNTYIFDVSQINDAKASLKERAACAQEEARKDAKEVVSKWRSCQLQ